VKELDQRLRTFQTQRTGTTAQHDRAHALLDQLRAAATLAQTTCEQCRAEIDAGPEGPPAPCDDGAVNGLASWLDTLDATVDARKWAPAGVGLARWLEAADAELHKLKEAEDRAKALLDRRADLAGRLSARRQQAKTLVARGTITGAGLDAIAKEAAEVLARVPCPIGEAEQLVRRYEAEMGA
jgi:hypothetical protein